MADSKLDEAVKLKGEGNKHFERKEYSQAYDKYSASLRKGGENAIIYANRAACLLGQRKFLDAEDDAMKATKIDPTYSKAWGRLAAAYAGQSKLTTAITAFQTALDNLPKHGLSAAQQKQKQQYEDGIRDAKEQHERGPPELIHMSAEKAKDNLPWEKALKIIKNIPPLQYVPTSAWLIGKAYEDWLEGLENLKQLQQIKMENGALAYSGSAQVYMCFTNAILRDRRVFHIRSNWLEEMEKQCFFETSFCDASSWQKQGPKLILKEAQERVAKYGWDTVYDKMGHPQGGVRQAISTQIRTWILRAFIKRGLTGDNTASESLFKDTLDFLEDGRKIWANVEREDRGTIFDDTFVRGVRVMHLNAYLNATLSSKKGKYTLKSLFEHAKKLHDETMASERLLNLHDPGFSASFSMYPIGEAMSTMAFCYRKMANEETDKNKRKKLLQQAGQLYLSSTEYYFDDDELHSCFLAMSLGAYWHFGSNLDVTLPIMKRLRLAVPKMRAIWGQTLTAGQSRDDPVETCLVICEEVLGKISSGELKETSPYTPSIDRMRFL